MYCIRVELCNCEAYSKLRKSSMHTIIYVLQDCHMPHMLNTISYHRYSITNPILTFHIKVYTIVNFKMLICGILSDRSTFCSNAEQVCNYVSICWKLINHIFQRIYASYFDQNMDDQLLEVIWNTHTIIYINILSLNM